MGSRSPTLWSIVLYAVALYSPFLNHIRQYLHHGNRLLLRKPLLLQPLHKLERIEVMIAPSTRGLGECSASHTPLPTPTRPRPRPNKSTTTTYILRLDRSAQCSHSQRAHSRSPHTNSTSPSPSPSITGLCVLAQWLMAVWVRGLCVRGRSTDEACCGPLWRWL